MDRKEYKEIVEDVMRPTIQKLDQMHKVFTGDGDSAKSYPVRLDRLERSHMRHMKIVWAMFLAAMGVCGAWVKQKLYGA